MADYPDKETTVLILKLLRKAGGPTPPDELIRRFGDSRTVGRGRRKGCLGAHRCSPHRGDG